MQMQTRWITQTAEDGYRGGRPYFEIVSVMRSRQADNTPLLNAMLDVKNKYNGPALDYVLPGYVPEDSETMGAYTPLLMAEIIDGQAMRAASVGTPNIYSPVVRPGVQKGTGSRAWARRRVYSLKSVMRHSRFELGLGRLFRQLSAYGSCSAVVFPDDKIEQPRIEIRDALTAYPDLRAAEDFRSPEDVGFITGRSSEWLRRVFPESQIENGGPVQAVSGTADRIWDVVEWIDGDIVMIGILGPRDTRYGQSTWQYQDEAGEFMELRRFPNKAGIFPGMLPARVTLDTILSQVMNVTGHLDVMAKLQLLDVIQSERAIMPDMYMVGANGRPPRVLNDGGNWQDGRTSKINQVLNASAIGTLNTTPDQVGRQTADRMERNVRVSSGLTPAQGGENYSSLRTGRAIDAMNGIAIEPRIRELHQIMQSWLPDLNRGILETYKGYYGSKKFSLYTGAKGTGETVEFVPKQIIETTETDVAYTIPGADVVQINVILTQMLGANLASRRSIRRDHPWIEGDGSEEQRFIDEEKAEQLVIETIAQKIQQGAAPLMLLVYFEEARREDPDGDAITALSKANDRIQKEQATQAPPPDQGAGQVLPPEAMPGVDAGPGGAAQQMPPGMALPPGAQPPGGPGIGPSPGQEGMQQLFSAIASGNRPIGQ